MKEVLPQKFHIKVRVYNEEINFGKGVAQLLQLIDSEGSLAAAYKVMGMSSSKAWKILSRAQDDLGFALVQGSSGGRHGGSTVLTAEGRYLLQRYLLFEKDVQQYAGQRFAEYFKKS